MKSGKWKKVGNKLEFIVDGIPIASKGISRSKTKLQPLRDKQIPIEPILSAKALINRSKLEQAIHSIASQSKHYTLDFSDLCSLRDKFGMWETHKLTSTARRMKVRILH